MASQTPSRRSPTISSAWYVTAGIAGLAVMPILLIVILYRPELLRTQQERNAARSDALNTAAELHQQSEAVEQLHGRIDSLEQRDKSVFSELNSISRDLQTLHQSLDEERKRAQDARQELNAELALRADEADHLRKSKHELELLLELVDLDFADTELSREQHSLRTALQASPKNDEIRFHLGIVQFLCAIERLEQYLHRYGVKSENTNIPFLRLPVPDNPNPLPISYETLHRIFDRCERDLMRAEATLAAVTDDSVKLKLKLTTIRFDLTGDGRAKESLVPILKKLLRQDLPFLKDNPDFLVCFDRGDVAWLRAYCHLLSAVIDFYLAFDTRALFAQSAQEVFAKPQNPFKGNDKEEKQMTDELGTVFIISEPERLSHFRKHMLQVCSLNRETWKYIRAETDDDHEWLPNPKQHGVLGLPVTDRMIDSWLRMIGQIEDVLEGRVLLVDGNGLFDILGDTGDKGLNLKTVLEDPPQKINWESLKANGPAAKYLQKGKTQDWLSIAMSMFQAIERLSLGYAVWFN
jgi:hypothetical protein